MNILSESEKRFLAEIPGMETYSLTITKSPREGKEDRFVVTSVNKRSGCLYQSAIESSAFTRRDSGEITNDQAWDEVMPLVIRALKKSSNPQS